MKFVNVYKYLKQIENNFSPLLRVCVHGVCVFIAVCVQCTLDGLNAEHKPRVWVTILGRISRHFHFHFKHGMNVMENGNVERTVYMAFFI